MGKPSSLRLCLALMLGCLVSFPTGPVEASPGELAYTRAKRLLDGIATKVAWRRLPLNRTAKRVARVDGLKNLHVGFTWDTGDNKTHDWYPQGIAGLPGKRLAISWYSKHGTSGAKGYPTSAAVKNSNNRGVRISFVDVSRVDRVKYRHVLLVKPSKGGTNFQAVRDCHAGGIAVLGNLLYVAETKVGVRVFDLNDLYAVEPSQNKSKIGAMGKKAYAHSYSYALLQRKVIPLEGPRFSYIGVDWTWRADGDSPLLVTGNYHSKGKYDNPPVAMVWWRPVNGGLDLEQVRHSKQGSGLGLPQRAQGGVSRDGVIWISQSGSEPRLRVGRYPFDSASDMKAYSWPTGPEDLHYSKRSGNLWSLTEWPRDRYFFAVKANRYGP